MPHVVAARLYNEVFHARTITLTQLGDLTIHAQLDFGNGHLHLEMPNPTGGGLAAPDGSDRTVFAYFCEDVEVVIEPSVAVGVKQLGPVVEFPSGDRFIAVRDPYGVRWSITSRVADRSAAESAHRVAEWAAHRTT